MQHSGEAGLPDTAGKPASTTFVHGKPKKIAARTLRFIELARLFGYGLAPMRQAEKA
jgi:hypothetical protein